MVEAAMMRAEQSVPYFDEARSEAWDRDGWALIPAFLGAGEIAELRREADRLMANRRLFEERGAIPNSAVRNDRVDPVIDVSPPFAAMARDKRLTGLVDDVLCGEAQLLKDRYIGKPPGAMGYGTHQDAAYWPGLGIEPARFLTALLFLDPCNAANGAVECSPGHHRGLLTEPGVIADPDEATLGAFTTVDAEPGDLLLLHALTPHRSGINRSSAMRRTILFTYGIDHRPDLYGRYQSLRPKAQRA